jgi:hypothetical protein
MQVEFVFILMQFQLFSKVSFYCCAGEISGSKDDPFIVIGVEKPTLRLPPLIVTWSYDSKIEILK